MEILIKIYDQDDKIIEIARHNCDSICATTSDNYIIINIPERSIFIDKNKEEYSRYSKKMDWRVFFQSLIRHIEEKRDITANLIKEKIDDENKIYPLDIS